MATNATEVQAGQDVLGADGKKIGTVAGVLKDTAGSIPATPGLEIPDTIERRNRSTHYIRVEATGGILSTGMREFYVPLDAIQNSTERSVTLSCTADECEGRYQTKPDFIES
jgi:hypothetical protein